MGDGEVQCRSVGSSLTTRHDLYYCPFHIPHPITLAAKKVRSIAHLLSRIGLLTFIQFQRKAYGSGQEPLLLGTGTLQATHCITASLPLRPSEFERNDNSKHNSGRTNGERLTGFCRRDLASPSLGKDQPPRPNPARFPFSQRCFHGILRLPGFRYPGFYFCRDGSGFRNLGLASVLLAILISMCPFHFTG